MLQSNELRLGNIISYGGQPNVVRWIKDNSIGIRKKNLQPLTADISKIKGMALTEQILLDCGFEFIDWLGEWCDKNHCIMRMEEGFLFQMHCTNDDDYHLAIKFTHQLQNIFYLISGGKELEINL